jgi:imidazolonepropionase-like amidohydrolase
MKRLALIVLIVLFSVCAVFSEGKETYLIKNANIYPVVGEKIERGCILIENGKIKKVAKDITPTEEAVVIDAAGMYVYPGFIDSYTHLGLIEISSIAASVDTRELGKENPELKVIWAINPQSVHFAISRINGTTTAMVAPTSGTFPGISALVKMDGWTIDEMLLDDDATSIINFPVSPKPTRESRIKKEEKAKIDITEKLVEKIKKYLAEARRYHELKKIAEKNKSVSSPEINAKFEALGPVLRGELPVMISVEKAKDIKLAIKFVKEEKLKAVFFGCAQGYMVADKIARAKIPVILDSLYTRPSEPEEPYDAQWTNPAKLAEAGVVICFSSGGSPAMAKDLPYHAGRAVAFGLDRDEAIKAVTINPAKVFGVDDRIGSIEPGKDADLFITTGDPLDPKSAVKYLFIDGRKIDLSNWWEQLYDKWSNRPQKSSE